MSELAPQSWNVGLMQPDEVEAMAQLYRETWRETFTREPFNVSADFTKQKMDNKFKQEELDRLTTEAESQFEDRNRAWFVARDSHGGIMGVAAPKRRDDEGQQRVGAIYVDREYRGQGVADELIDRVVEWSDPTEPLYLWVADQNERAIGFYERHGFLQVQDKRDYFYENNVPHIKMVRHGAEQ